MESDKHFPVGEIRSYKAEGAGGDIEVRQDSYNHIMVNPVKGFAEVNKASKNRSRFLVVFVKVPVDEIQHQDEVVFYRTSREASKLVKINVVIDVGPYPLNEEPLQPFAKERCQAKVSEVIL